MQVKDSSSILSTAAEACHSLKQLHALWQQYIIFVLHVLLQWMLTVPQRPTANSTNKWFLVWFVSLEFLPQSQPPTTDEIRPLLKKRDKVEGKAYCRA